MGHGRWTGVGVAVLAVALAAGACGNGDSSVTAEDVRQQSPSAVEPTIPPEEGGAAREPIIPPEEGGPTTAAPTPGRPGTSVAPSRPTTTTAPTGGPDAPPAGSGNVVSSAPLPPSVPPAGVVTTPPSTAPPAVPPTTAAPAVPAQSGVVGRVTNAATGAPVVTAAVEAAARDPQRPSAALAAVTDADGRYAWPLAPGSWDLTVSAPGYRSVTRTVVVPSGPSVTADFALDRTP